MIALHVIGSYLVPTNPDYEIDAHNIKIIKYCKVLVEMGYVLHFYGANGCQEHVYHTHYHPVISLNEYDEVIKNTNRFTNPEYLMVGFVRFEPIKEKINKIFSTNTLNLLEQNYKRGDLVLHFFQSYSYDNMTNVRMAHGGGNWNMYKYVTFETLSYMNYELSRIPKNDLKISGVIHPWFDPNDYIYDPSRKYSTPTYLFMAGCHMYKGIHYFLEFSKHCLQYDFIIAGGTLSYDDGLMNIGHIDGDEDNYIDLTIYPNVKYIGPIFGREKKELLAKVTALIQPTYYFEPCGWNVLEAMISGTPVLTSHFGGFLDTVVDGVTGYLTKPTEWLVNIEKVKSIKSIDCLMHVVNNFNSYKAGKSIKNFLNKITNIVNHTI